MSWRAVTGSVLLVGACTGVAALMRTHFDLTNVSIVYMVAVVLSAVAFGRGPAMLTAVLGVVAFDVLFVPPFFSLSVADTQYLITLAVMLLVAVVIGTLTASVRTQRDEARRREDHAAALYRLTHEMAREDTVDGVLRAAATRVGELLGVRLAVLHPDDGGMLRVAAGDAGALDGQPGEWDAARRAWHDGQVQGLGHGGEPGPGGLHVPLRATTAVLAVLSLAPDSARVLRRTGRMALLRALASQTALALERCWFADEARRARLQADTERMRNTLLTSVSHDLRTPLAAITGAASTLRDDAGRLPEATRRELAEMISDQSGRLNRLIGNLLAMTRLEAGALDLRREWYPLEEVVGSALAGLEPALAGRPITVALPDDLPLVALDDVLFAQALRNVIENAHQYAPPGTPIGVAATCTGGRVLLEVTDRGPGIAPGEEERIFEKFRRGSAGGVRAGAGLGLAISRGIVVAHGGTLTAINADEGGSCFRFSLPVDAAPHASGDTPTLKEVG